MLESLGLKPKLGPKALAVHGTYMAGSREDRLSDLHAMFLDDEVRAIFCTGGGDSAMQLLSGIDWELIKKNPKIFMGYSDITTILAAMHEKTDLVTFHGPTIESFNAETKGGKYTLENFKNMLMKGKAGELEGYTEWKVLKPGRDEGELVGGNLNTLTYLLGTPFEPKWDGKILFWEEVNETVAAIDNFLWHLRNAKVFKKIEGMVVGKITNLETIEDETEKWASMDRPPLIEDIILKATEGYNFPILYGVDFGHDVPSLTLPIGTKALLDCPVSSRTGRLYIQERYLKD